MNRIKELEENIKFHNNLYHNLGNSEISDFEFDKFLKELKELDPNNLLLTATAGNATFGKKIKHSSPMGSLLKCHSINEIIIKFGNTTLISMPKIDGLSLSITYENGILKQALTRGNGFIGEDVTENAKQISNIPKNISIKEKIEVRGEVYVNKTWFFKFMSHQFKNSRNYAAGSLKQKNPKITKDRNLSFVAYKISLSMATKEEELEYLKSLNFEIPIYFLSIDSNSLLSHEQNINYFKDYRYSFDYDIDGIVFCINNTAFYRSKGFALDNATPKGAIAFKFDTDKTHSIINDIIWNISRTGKIVPVMIINEIKLAGTSVKRVTLNNINYIKENDVAIGDTVLIEKANEIIPKLVSVLIRPNGRYINIPKFCPGCGGNTIIKGAHLFCTNKNCQYVKKNQLLYFIRSLNIKGFSTASIEKIINSGLLNSKTIFEFEIKDFQKIGFGPTQSKTFYMILKNIKLEPAEFLNSLGINNVGKTTWEKVLEIWSFEDILNNNILISKLKQHIGEKTGQAVYNGLNENKDFINSIISYIDIVETNETNNSTSNKLNGKTFCITGTLSKSRNEFIKSIADNGGKFKSVSNGLEYLIVGINPGSKLEKAKQLGIKIINEEEFNNLIK